MKSLNVPVVRQPKDSADCGVACVAMILKYYRVPFEYEQLRKDIGVKSWGTVTPQLGLYLLRHGFEVDIVSMQPALFNLAHAFKTPQALLKHLHAMRPGLKGKFNPTALNYFIKFVEAGGTLTPRIPTEADIRAEIVAKCPLLVPLTHWFLSMTRELPRFTIHYNVITGIDKTRIAANDPDWGNPLGGKHIFNSREYLYAIYAGAHGGIDDACIMKIKKTK